MARLWTGQWYGIAIVHKEVTALSIKLPDIEFPAGTPAGEDYVLRNGEFWCQADELYFPAYKVIEQDIGMAITIKISHTNIQV